MAVYLNQDIRKKSRQIILHPPLIIKFLMRFSAAITVGSVTEVVPDPPSATEVPESTPSDRNYIASVVFAVNEWSARLQSLFTQNILGILVFGLWATDMSTSEGRRRTWLKIKTALTRIITKGKALWHACWKNMGNTVDMVARAQIDAHRLQ